MCTSYQLTKKYIQILQHKSICRYCLRVFWYTNLFIMINSDLSFKKCIKIIIMLHLHFMTATMMSVCRELLKSSLYPMLSYFNTCNQINCMNKSNKVALNLWCLMYYLGNSNTLLIR